MMLVDSSVWIDYFRGTRTIQALELDRALDSEVVFLGDLVLTEVLQGFRSDAAAAKAVRRLSAAAPLVISDHRVATEAARNYRFLRDKGRTIRKTIDTLIATRCILDGIPLLYSDRDFDPFVAHLGLRAALPTDTGVT